MKNVSSIQPQGCVRIHGSAKVGADSVENSALELLARVKLQTVPSGANPLQGCHLDLGYLIIASAILYKRMSDKVASLQATANTWSALTIEHQKAQLDLQAQQLAALGSGVTAIQTSLRDELATGCQRAKELKEQKRIACVCHSVMRSGANGNYCGNGSMA